MNVAFWLQAEVPSTPPDRPFHPRQPTFEPQGAVSAHRGFKGRRVPAPAAVVPLGCRDRLSFDQRSTPAFRRRPGHRQPASVFFVQSPLGDFAASISSSVTLIPLLLVNGSLQGHRNLRKRESQDRKSPLRASPVHAAVYLEVAGMPGLDPSSAPRSTVRRSPPAYAGRPAI